MTWRSLPGAPASGTRLCRLEDLADPGSKGFSFGAGTMRFEMFLVRRGPLVRGYVNQCPHARSPLDWQPDMFLDPGRTQIQCASHGALFRIDNGQCVGGPARGKALMPVPVEIAAGEVRIAGPD